MLSQNALQIPVVIPLKERIKRVDRSFVFIAEKPLPEKYYFAKNQLVRLHQSIGNIRIEYPADLADLAVWSSGDSCQFTLLDLLECPGGDGGRAKEAESQMGALLPPASGERNYRLAGDTQHDGQHGQANSSAKPQILVVARHSAESGHRSRGGYHPTEEILPPDLGSSR